MSALLLSALLASLAGSLHCAGMCGPFSAFWAAPGGSSRMARMAPSLAYHAARLLTYASLGALAGAAGKAVEIAAAGRVRSAAALVAGILLVAWGLAGLLRHAGLRLPLLPAPAPLRRCVSGATSALRSRPPVQRAAAIGLLTTLLPCGWLHAFVLAAAATGAPGRGALLMTAFWLGTVPVLAAISGGALAILGPLRRHAPAVSAAAVIAVGILSIVHHARAVSSPEPPPCHDPARPVVLSGEK